MSKVAKKTRYLMKRQKANYKFIVKIDTKTSVTTLTSKNVYLVMDRTFGYNNYGAANVELLNNVINILEDAGFNIKYSKIGPSYIYNGAMYMYNNKIKDSIYFAMCNGADVDVFYEFITKNDNRITAMRSRNNTVVLGFFYECGDFYNEGGTLCINGVNRNFTAHKVQELLNDRKTETCSFNVFVA